jgi:tetratricopeptide (TPR) repeat protein
MGLKPTIVAAVLAFGAAALLSQIDLRGDAPAPPVAAPQPGGAATGARYPAVLAELDRRADALQRRASGRPDDWLIRSHLAAALLERANLTNQVDDLARVQTALDESFALVPRGTGPVLLAARFNFSIHRLAAAEAHLDMLDGHAIPRRDDVMAARLLRAQIAVQRGQYAVALDGLTAIAAEAPSLATPELALYHAKTGDPRKAEALLEAALTKAKDPQHRAWTRLQLGIVAMNRGELQLALQHLQAAEAELAGWWLVQEHIAEVHIRRSNHARAVVLFEELVREADLPQHMDSLAGLYRHTGKPQEADALISQAAARWDLQLARFPESAMGHALQHHLQFGAPARALELALANYALRPGGDAMVSLARAHLKAGQAAEALAVAERALATPYRAAALHDVAAKAHAALGHTAAADEQLALCYAINPMYTSTDHSH